ncbi:MAG TPA: leucine-rich repeat domain-containing protein [Bacteroidales bacterium]|nr:leucine-rich repeat domain-containing protein [Bacteroidales bacterium]
MKKFIVLVTTLLFVGFNLVIAEDPDFAVGGIHYLITSEEDPLEVSVTYEIEDVSTDTYTGNLVIPASVIYEGKKYTVTGISKKAFWDCETLKSITLPASLTSISSSAFYNCDGLTTLIIPNSITEIDYDAFYECNSLKTITLSSKLEKIGDNAFGYCTSLTSITLPATVTELGKDVFYQCKSLASIKVGTGSQSFSSVDGVLFNKALSALIRYPEAKLNTTFVVPKSVTRIENYAFNGCAKLTEITLPDTLGSIGDNELFNVFDNCTLLTKINAGPNSRNFSSVDGVLFNKTKTKLIQYPACKKDVSYSVPPGVVMIGGSAFNSIQYLKNLTLPESVNEIGAFSFTSALSKIVVNAKTPPKVHTYSFHLVTFLRIEVPGSSISSYKAANGWKDYSISEIALYDFVVDNIFYKITSEAAPLTVEVSRKVESVSTSEYTGNVVVPPTVNFAGKTYSVNAIGESAFSWCSGLTSLTLPNSVVTIKDNAFNNCKVLSNVTLGNSVTTIEKWAFSNCSALASIEIPASITSIGNYAFNYAGLKSITIPNSVTSIGNFAFFNCTELDTITLPASLKRIEEYTFAQCTKLGSIVIPNSVALIANAAFTESGINNITLSQSLKSIGERAFSKCKSLKEITIPDSVTVLGKEIFLECAELTTVKLGRSLLKVPESAFQRCSKLTSVELNNALESIEKYAFYYCNNLPSVVIPEKVKQFGDYAFSSCYALEKIRLLSKTPTSVNEMAFDGRYNLCTLEVPGGTRSAYLINPWSKFQNIKEY